MTAAIIAGLIFVYCVAIPIQAILEAKHEDEQTKRLWRIQEEHQDFSDWPAWRLAIRRWILE